MNAVLEQHEDEAIMNMQANRRAMRAFANKAAEEAGATSGGGGEDDSGARRAKKANAKRRTRKVLQFDIDETPPTTS